MSKKPFNLQVVYLKNANPSELQAAFDLQLKILGFPTEIGASQYVNPFGFHDSAFGISHLVFNQYVRITSFDTLTFASPGIYNLQQSLRVGGFVNTGFGQGGIYNLLQYIGVSGADHSRYGNANLKNKNQEVRVSGFIATQFSRQDIYNLKQFINVLGMDHSLYGTAYFQGGVKYVYGSGFNSSAIPQPKVINTRANRIINLNTHGIVPITPPMPNVSPRILYPKGILAWSFGMPIVRRNPSPTGFTTDRYGTAWVSHSPRYIQPDFVKAFESGYAKVFDPKQRIYHEGSPPIPAGIFGDISIKNTRRIINVPGSNQSLYGDWSEVRSNLSMAGVQSFDANIFGTTEIRNKTPSVIPNTWDSMLFGNTFISDRIRRINVRGIDWPESQRFGKHVLTKPPEIKLAGLNSMRFGEPWVSNKTREIPPPGMNTLRFNEPVVWFRYRHISVTDIGIPGFAQPKVEHGLRFILGQGDSHLRFGSPTVWFRVRKLIPSSIYREFESKHLIGGTQHIRHSGFVATQFGERIVPENHAVYPLGFNGQAFSEKNQIELHTRWVRAKGFLSFGTQTSDRYGTASVWNKRQYVQHNYDSGDGLNPGSFGQWTSIANRNRVIGALGFAATKYGNHAIAKNARLLAPGAIQANAFGKLMIADRIRHLRPGGMESPYISGWGCVHNSAFVIAPVSGKHDQWGKPSVVNTRREYRWIGAFDSMAFGQPMIAFRIRKLSMESRYSIGPIYLPIPKVHLHTRYIDPPGSDLLAFGGINLHIKWNTFTPRWTHRDLFGDATVRNVTPELKQRGNNSEVFGIASLRTQWRHLPMEGYGSELWGKTNIAYRDRSISITGFNAFRFGQHKVIRTGAPPYSLQNITLDWAGEGKRPEGFEGNGIEIPKNQVPPPNVKSNVLFTEGFIATLFGSHHIQSNGILVYPGIQEMTIGEPAISLKNRVIEVPTMGDLLQLEDVKPRLSPHTIYAVNNAPQQAIKNHPTQGEIKYINDHGSHVGEIFGRVTVTLQHRKIFVGAGDELSMGRAQVFLSKRYIEPTGFLSFRMGWHNCLDGSPQTMVQYDSEDQSLFGEHLVKINYTGPQKILDRGFNSAIFGATKIEFFNRPIYPKGYQATLMGTRVSNDTPYKPKGLWVGKPMPTIPDGFNAELFGDTTISLRVRDITAIGFDSFVSEMDISNFKGRMKVELVKKPVVIEPKEVFTQSFVNTNYGVPDIRLKTHYIRPDGNSDQYRKGGPT